MLLEVDGLTKRFGGVIANRDISFEVSLHEIVGIIGPNGAGKSTVFDLISGYYRPDHGQIRFDGVAIAGLPPHAINRRGVARTFQKLRPFVEMTAEDNVVVAALPRSSSVETAREEARRVLRLVGLGEKMHVFARGLSTGQRKRLEMARAMATRPTLLLLDEVTGGVDQPSIPGLIELIRTLRDQGVTILVIEHNMRVVTSVSERVVALHLGEKIAEGRPDEVMRDPRVADAYLGQVHAAP